MNWGNLKDEIRDLGFETDEIFEEYENIIINACNRAIDIIRYTFVAKYENFYEDYFDITTGNMESITKITVDTEDSFEINLPDNTLMLLPLLCSHYVWLDDDTVKATLYWNEYDDLKNQLVQNIITPRHAVVEGGF